MDCSSSKAVATQIKTDEEKSENVEGEAQKPPYSASNEIVGQEKSYGVLDQIKDSVNIRKTLIKRSVENEARIDEPLAKKVKTDEQDASGTDEEEEERPIDGECVIDSLPIEVLEMILAHISSWSDRKKIRGVCKLWYKVSNRQNQSGVFIRDFKKIRKRSATYEHLVNCGFEYLNLCFGAWDFERFPIYLWKKIGVKIRSLEFTDCPLGDQTLENVILFCPNLRILRIHLKFKLELDANMAISSVETLNKLDVVRSQLETFDISVNRTTISSVKQFPLIRNVDYGTWQPIFEALFRIFPNIVQFSWTKYYSRQTVFKCAFTRESEEVSDNSIVASVLAHSLSANNWRTAFDDLETLRLTSISLHISDNVCKTPEDEISMLNFFKSSRKLKSVQLTLPINNYRNVLKSMLFIILDNCSKLRTLKYFKHSSWLPILKLDENERSRLIKSLSKLEKVSMSNFSLQPMSRSVSCGWTISSVIDKNSDYCFERTSNFLFRCYPDVQHLTLKQTSNDTLQGVFKFLVHLKSLNVGLSSDVTNFGITGRLNGDPHAAITGYSINRLQNLEKLTIRRLRFRGEINEKIYMDFHFPNLHFLSSCLPCETSTFALIGTLMPSLKTIYFVDNWSFAEEIPVECLVALGQTSTCLHSIRTDFKIMAKDARQIFEVCPTLRFLYGLPRHKTFYYDHIKKKVVLSYQNPTYVSG